MSRQCTLEVRADGKGLTAIDRELSQALASLDLPETGLVHLFVQHTSASLLIQENADPSARQDLEEFLDRLAPDREAWHRHTTEGPDDTTAHMKASVTPHSLSIPIVGGKLGLGTWQGIYLCEHRAHTSPRRIVVTVIGA